MDFEIRKRPFDLLDTNICKHQAKPLICFVFGFEGAKMYKIFGDDAFGGHTRSHTEHDG